MEESRSGVGELALHGRFERFARRCYEYTAYDILSTSVKDHFEEETTPKILQYLIYAFLGHQFRQPHSLVRGSCVKCARCPSSQLTSSPPPLSAAARVPP